MNVYPSTDPANYGVRGLEWPVVRKPQFSNAIKTTTTGKEYRLKYWNNPRWHWKISYVLLNDIPTDLYLTNLYTDLRTIEGFFLGQQGMFQKFLFWDPSDNTVAGQAIGVGDGTKLEFQLVRNFGIFTEAIQAPTGPMTAYVDGSPLTPNVDYVVEHISTCLQRLKRQKRQKIDELSHSWNMSVLSLIG